MFAAVILALAGALALGQPRPAHACSAGPDFDPLEGHDVIIAGRATGIEILGRTGIMTYLNLRITFEVDRYLVGDGPSTLHAFDSRSGTPPFELIPNTAAFEALDLATLDVDDLGYDGGGGACGALDDDPREHYWVTGLGRGPDGELYMHRLSVLAIGDGPSDPRVLEAIARVEARFGARQVAPPATGSGGLAARGQESPSTNSPVAAFLTFALVLLLIARRATRSESVEPR